MTRTGWMNRRYDETVNLALQGQQRRETEMTIDWTKPIETRERGLKLFYIGKRQNGDALVEFVQEGVIEHNLLYSVSYETGDCRGDMEISVRNVPEKPKIETRWVNVYEPITYDGYSYYSKEKADKAAAKSRNGLIEITYKDGKPIDVKLHPVDK